MSPLKKIRLNKFQLNKRADLVLSAMVYIGGTASMFALDLFLSKVLESDPELMADWAFFRAIVLFGSAIALFGCEQAVVRAPTTAKRLLPPLTAQVLLLCLPLIALPWFVPMAFSGVEIFLAAASLGLIMGICGHFRSHLRVTLSQVCANGWKLVFGSVVMVMWWQQVPWQRIGFAMVGCLAVCAIICVLIGAFSSHSNETEESDSIAENGYLSLLPIGSRFWMFAIMANCVTHLDQILLSLDGQKLDASLFFSYRALFLPVVLLAIGYIGVVVAPYIRKNPDRFRTQAKRWLAIFIGLGGLVTILAFASGLGMGWILGKFDQGVDWLLVTAFLIVGMLRYAYIMPSAMMSVYATRKELDRMLLVSLLGVATMVVAYVLMRQLGFRPIWSVIIGSICNSIFRIAYGIWLSIHIFRSGRPVGALS